jgi:CHAT domain-containing protein
MVRSFLALAGANRFRSTTGGDDGILTALEVTSMDLHQTDLVVLSACQTALGETFNGEGVFGLRRAFALAGAENLVMSLWPVSEALAVDQIKWFYEGVSEGLPVADAMRDSQLKTMEEVRKITEAEIVEPLPLVRLWAPFIVQQSGRN